MGWVREYEMPPRSAHVCEPMPPSLKIPVDPVERFHSIEVEHPNDDISDESEVSWCWMAGE